MFAVSNNVVDPGLPRPTAKVSLKTFAVDPRIGPEQLLTIPQAFLIDL